MTSDASYSSSSSFAPDGIPLAGGLKAIIDESNSSYTSTTPSFKFADEMVKSNKNDKADDGKSANSSTVDVDAKDTDNDCKESVDDVCVRNDSN